jgi:hypothetical protein
LPGTAEAPGAPATRRERGGARAATVFVLDAGEKPQPVRVRQGITDGQFVEIRDGLTEGQAVVTGIADPAARNAAPRGGASPAANPFSPARPQRRQR